MRCGKTILYVADRKSRGKVAFNRAAALVRNNRARLTVVNDVQRTMTNVELLGIEQMETIQQAEIEGRQGIWPVSSRMSSFRKVGGTKLFPDSPGVVELASLLSAPSHAPGSQGY